MTSNILHLKHLWNPKSIDLLRLLAEIEQDYSFLLSGFFWTTLPFKLPYHGFLKRALYRIILPNFLSSWYQLQMTCFVWEIIKAGEFVFIYFLFLSSTGKPNNIQLFLYSHQLQGVPKKMSHSDFQLKSVPEVRLYFFTCVSKSEFRAHSI